MFLITGLLFVYPTTKFTRTPEKYTFQNGVKVESGNRPNGYSQIVWRECFSLLAYTKGVRTSQAQADKIEEFFKISRKLKTSDPLFISKRMFDKILLELKITVHKEANGDPEYLIGVDWGEILIRFAAFSCGQKYAGYGDCYEARTIFLTNQLQKARDYLDSKHVTYS